MKSKLTEPERLLTASSLCRRLRFGKRRVFGALRSGVIRADFRTDCGSLLFRSYRLNLIRETLKTYRLK